MTKSNYKPSWTLKGLSQHWVDAARNRFIKRFGYRLKISSRFDGVEAYGVQKIDKELAGMMKIRRGYYCELGAYDGIRQSNTLLLEMHYGWHGILVEPVGETFRELVGNRSRRRNRLVHAAAVGFNYQDDKLPIAVAGLMSTPAQGNSDIGDPISNARLGLSNQKKFAKLKNEPAIELCPAKTLTKIFEEQGSPSKVNLLSLDVEGSEIEVLEGIDFDRYSFDWIVVESRTPTRMKEFLGGKGYRFVKYLTEIDMVFRHETQN